MKRILFVLTVLALACSNAWAGSPTTVGIRYVGNYTVATGTATLLKDIVNTAIASGVQTPFSLYIVNTGAAKAYWSDAASTTSFVPVSIPSAGILASGEATLYIGGRGNWGGLLATGTTTTISVVAFP